MQLQLDLFISRAEIVQLVTVFCRLAYRKLVAATYVSHMHVHMHLHLQKNACHRALEIRKAQTQVQLCLSDAACVQGLSNISLKTTKTMFRARLAQA